MASAKSPTEANGTRATEEHIEGLLKRAIDQLDILRVEMRKIGKTECATVLDEAFATCLRAYVEHREGRPIDSPAPGRHLPEKPDGEA
jgi:predicted RNase H-like HicB family nuclease